MGISLILAAMMLKTALLQTPVVQGLLPSAETSAGFWIRSLIELPIVGALFVLLAGFVCGSLLMVPVLALAAISRHPFVVAFRNHWQAKWTPEEVAARRWIGFPLLAAVFVALAISEFAHSGWNWQVIQCILLGSICLWTAIRPQHWGVSS
jgi:hypothetical protein